MRSLIFPLGEKHQIHRISRKAKPVAELLDSDTSVYDNNTLRHRICVIIARNSSRKFLCLGLALVLSGALGNAWDRFTIGVVVDFLDFHVGSYHWPAFNVADICICCGAGIVVLAEFFGKKN